MLKILDATLAAIDRLLMALTAALILIMAVVVTADVLGRNLLLFAIPWSAELAEYGLYLSSVLIAPWLLRHGHHISIGVIVEALPARVARTIIAAGELLCAAVSAVFSWYAFEATLRSYSDGSLVIKNIIFPGWWVFVPLTAIFLLLAVEFVIQCIRGPSASGAMPL